MQKAITELNEFELEFESEFLIFFNEILIFVENYKKNL
jgi:hypothetical protein